MYEFFDDLSFMGWIGVGIWLGFILSIGIKKEWYFSVEERKPYIRSFDKYTYTDSSAFVFLILRFIVICIGVFGFGSILTMI